MRRIIRGEQTQLYVKSKHDKNTQIRKQQKLTITHIKNTVLRTRSNNSSKAKLKNKHNKIQKLVNTSRRSQNGQSIKQSKNNQNNENTKS